MYHHCGPCRSCPARRLLEFLGCRSGIGAYPLILSWPHKHTVDGRNPAPAHVVSIPLFTGFCTSQVVQDFFHQQYEINSYKHIEMANSNCANSISGRPFGKLSTNDFLLCTFGLKDLCKMEDQLRYLGFPKTNWKFLGFAKTRCYWTCMEHHAIRPFPRYKGCSCQCCLHMHMI